MSGEVAVMAGLCAVTIGGMLWLALWAIADARSSAEMAAQIAEQRHVEQMERWDQMHGRQVAELQREREQWFRLIVSQNPGNYGALRRLDKTPDEDIGEADRHRAEMLASRQAQPQVPSPFYDRDTGEPIVPVGAG